ncbi:phage tail protein [Cupriavidus sp. DL-D2]|uniref:phage tail protein n=1 Tax=Cupriavidus sp. DL-D2 TaxID=3144974 RepID=UPI0032128A57
MSQHNFIVANQAGASYRADVNNALQALASHSSGAAAPPTPYAYQMWADTNTGLLKIRNGANSAWVTLGLLDVPLLGHIKPGMVVYHAKNAAPTGFLKANGGAVSRTTYADLFAEIGTTFGVGDGSTTFNVPELRAEFIRGWDDSRGVDSGRTFGSAQAQSIEAHTHLYGGSSSIMAPGGNAALTTGNSFGTSSYGGTETRPRNIALLACIKY